MRKTLSLLAFTMLGALVLAALSCQVDEKATLERDTGGEKVAVLLAPSGRGDRSYNDTVLSGLKSLENEGTIEIVDIHPAHASNYPEVIDEVADNVNLVIAVGFLYAEPIKELAAEHPDTHFLVIDGEVTGAPNVKSAVFRPEDGAFLAGAVAAAASQAGTVGFIGGMNIPIINRFECGFQRGVEFHDQEYGDTTKVIARYLGTSSEAFRNPAAGRNVARLLYGGGADVIFHAAGASGNGVIQAAREAGKQVIGVDTDQSHLGPEAVLTSMRKRLDLVAEDAVREHLAGGPFEAGVTTHGLKNDRVDLVQNPEEGDPLDGRLVEVLKQAEEAVVRGGAVSECEQ